MNKYKPNLQIFCEDSINHNIAQGFILGFINYSGFKNPAPIEICQTIANGWTKAKNELQSNWIPNLEENQNLFLLILIDSDSREKRINEIKSLIPSQLNNRIFIMGCLNEPEALKKQAKKAIKQMDKKAKQSDEAVGKVLFQHCQDNPVNNLWHSDELKHNLPEIERLKECTKKFIEWNF